MMNLNDIQKRFLLFLIGCIGTRISIMLLAKKIQPKYLPIMGYLALLPAIGFIYIYLTNSRKTGNEVFGDKIWWNYLRPIHSLLYFIFAYLAINKSPMSWIALLVDVIIGLCSFIFYHWSSNNFSRLFQS